MCLRPPATAPASAPAATPTAAGRRGRATVTPTRVARPLDRGPVGAAGRLTPLGLARPRLFGRPVRVVGVVRPGSDIGPIGAIRMVGMVGPAYVRPIRMIGS